MKGDIEDLNKAIPTDEITECKNSIYYICLS